METNIETLTPVDRMILMPILPAQSDVMTMRLVNELRTALSFTEQEIEDFEIKNEVLNNQKMTTWNVEKVNSAVPKGIAIGPTARKIIETALRTLNTDKKITLQLVPIYDRFVKDE